MANQIETVSQGEYMQVDGLDDLQVVHDYRTSYDPPSGDTRALVLRCKGPGTWSDGSSGPVMMIEVAVDGHDQTWLNWEPSQ